MEEGVKYGLMVGDNEEHRWSGVGDTAHGWTPRLVFPLLYEVSDFV